MNKIYIPIIKRAETCKVYLESILMIEQNLRKTMIYTEGDEYWRYGKINDLSKYLDDRFLKCHNSCIVNMDKIIKMREQTIYFENGFRVVVGRDNFKSARQNFARYILEKTNA